MAITKKETNSKGKTYLTFIDKKFKTVKDGKSAIAEIKLIFPASFVKKAKNGEHEFITIEATKLDGSLLITKDEKKPVTKK
jgi:hypothetical protein